MSDSSSSLLSSRCRAMSRRRTMLRRRHPLVSCATLPARLVWSSVRWPSRTRWTLSKTCSLTRWALRPPTSTRGAMRWLMSFLSTSLTAGNKRSFAKRSGYLFGTYGSSPCVSRQWGFWSDCLSGARRWIRLMWR